MRTQKKMMLTMILRRSMPRRMTMRTILRSLRSLKMLRSRKTTPLMLKTSYNRLS
jgi:hypothetical protein